MFQLYDTHRPIQAISEPTAITVGVFDGVHRGHKALLDQLNTQGNTLGASPLVVTLTSHPSYVLGRRANEYWLDEPEEHLQLLFGTGAKYIAVLPFTRDIAAMSACQLAEQMHRQLGMRALVLGYDGRFGSKSNDDFAMLPQLAEQIGFSIFHGSPYLIDGQPISSSRIRESLERGAVEETANLLGRKYSISGIVSHGRGVGHTLGFPTANIDLSASRKTLPCHGVYIVSIDGHRGMANLGPAPTFGIDKPLLEVHLLDFDGDLYDQKVDIQFQHRIRDIRHFNTSTELQEQLQKDMEQARLWS